MYYRQSIVSLKVEFFYFEDTVEDDIQTDINNFIDGKNIIDIKMTSITNPNDREEKILTSILVMYDDEEKT